MKNFERYQHVTTAQIDKRSLTSYVCRIPADRRLLPVLATIRERHVLEIGVGSGYYTRTLLANGNTVVGVDRNPHLCTLPITVHGGDATELESLVGDARFDVAFSGWMTEYLSPPQLDGFFKASVRVLRPGGRLIATIISPYGVGGAYVTLAKRVRGIDKYAYRWSDVRTRLEAAGFTGVTCRRLSSWLGIPWAMLVSGQTRAGDNDKAGGGGLG